MSCWVVETGVECWEVRDGVVNAMAESVLARTRIAVVKIAFATLRCFCWWRESLLSRVIFLVNLFDVAVR